MKPICPQCGAPAAWKDNPFRPFCSEKCKATDLGAWAMEKFRIEGEKAEISPSSPPSASDDPDEN